MDRGLNRESVFLDDDDRRAFLDLGEIEVVFSQLREPGGCSWDR
jgi:hypothetical protein